MLVHPDDTTSQAVARPWHALDFLQRHVRRLPEHEHAKQILDAVHSLEKRTDIALLFVHMADLEPNVGVGKGTWRIAQDAIKASKAVFIFGLLLVNYSQPEKNLVGFVEV
jgi:hypothetical protein